MARKGPGESPDDERIVIERRETIAIIEADPNGYRPMIAVALEAASGYVADYQPHDQPVSLEFGYRGMTYRVSRTED